MNLPSPLHPSKIVPALLFAGLCSALAGCAPSMAEAPFVARPDTSERADLRGPFDGRVLDGSTGKPVTGALVEVDWAFESPGALPAPAGQRSVTVETDHDGRYAVDPIAIPAGARLARTTLIIYQRGYVAFRSDRRFEDRSVRQDFAAQWVTVKLDRFAPTQSHARHVVFVGGGDRMHEALQEELIRASFELARESQPTTSAPIGTPLDASVLLSEDEYRAITGFAGPLVVEQLADLPQSPVYDSRHFRAIDKPESFDAAIRVWRLGAGAESKWKTLRQEIPGATALPNVGDAAVSGQEGNILAVAAFDRDHGTVIELTCGVEQCRSISQAAAMMRRLLARLDRLNAVPKGDSPSLLPPPPSVDGDKKTEDQLMPLDDTEPRTPPSKDDPAPDPDRPFQLQPPTLHR